MLSQLKAEIDELENIRGVTNKSKRFCLYFFPEDIAKNMKQTSTDPTMNK